jgi:hypothetical protein
MGESSQNEILILIEENHTNENEMDIEKDVQRRTNENVQIDSSKVEENAK